MNSDAAGHLGIVTALVRSSFLIDAVYGESAREYGITQQQGQLLCVLMSKPQGMGDLGNMLRLAKSSLTGMVDRTARRGLVRREPDPEDGRAVRIALTPQGERVAADFYTEACRRIEALTSGLPAPDREQLAELLGRVVLENKVPEVFAEPIAGP